MFEIPLDGTKSVHSMFTTKMRANIFTAKFVFDQNPRKRQQLVQFPFALNRFTVQSQIIVILSCWFMSESRSESFQDAYDFNAFYAFVLFTCLYLVLNFGLFDAVHQHVHDGA